MFCRDNDINQHTQAYDLEILKISVLHKFLRVSGWMGRDLATTDAVVRNSSGTERPDQQRINYLHLANEGSLSRYSTYYELGRLFKNPE